METERDASGNTEQKDYFHLFKQTVSVESNTQHIKQE